MTIKELLAMPISQKFGGSDYTIKTCKKRWEMNIGDAEGGPIKRAWMQQVVLTDETGDVLADVHIGGNNPLQRGSIIHITVGWIQQGVPEVGSKEFKKIFIDQFTQPTDIGEPAIELSETDKIVESKIRCLLVAATIQAGRLVDKRIINDYVGYVLKGE